MSETMEQAFIEDICAQPQDDTPRLVYADWLEDHGQPARAEFIRVQLCLKHGRGEDNHPLTPGSREALHQREKALLAAHRQEWEQPLRACCPNIKIHEFRRGMPYRVTLTAADFLDHAGELFARAPIQSVRIRDLTTAQVPLLAACQHLGKLTHLNLGGNAIGNGGATALADSPHLTNLTSLHLQDNNIGDDGARALACSPHLARLNCLDLEVNNIGAAGARALARSPYLRNVADFGLGQYLQGVIDRARTLLSPDALIPLP